MAIIHLSGCDCSGKSTLTRTLGERLGWRTVHFGKPRDLEDGKRQYFEFAKVMNGNPRANVVCDRLHDGEWVYAPLYRNYKGDYLREFECEITRVHNYLFVHVKAPLETIVDRARKRGEDYVQEEHFQSVLEAFDEFTNEQALPYIVIDTAEGGIEDHAIKISDAFLRVDRIWTAIRNGYCPDVIQNFVGPRGNVFGEIMVVAQNPARRGRDRNSTVWSSGALSEFVIDVTKRAGIHNDCWYTNLVPYPTTDNKVTKRQIEATREILELQIELLKPKVIVGMGNVVNESLRRIVRDIPIVELKHPAYVRRFLSGDPSNKEGYVAALAAAKDLLNDPSKR